MEIKKSSKLQTFGIDLGFMLVLACLTFFFACTAHFNFSVGGDYGVAHLGWTSNAKNILSGQLPLWNPYEWGGATSIGYVTQNFYPISMLLSLVFFNPETGILSHDIFFFDYAIHLTLFAWGMYFLLRSLKYNQAICFFSSQLTVFAGAYLSIRWVGVFTSMAWFPWFIMLARLYMVDDTRRTWAYSVLAGIVLGLICMTGYNWVLMAVLLYAVLYFCVVWGYRKDKKHLLKITGASVLTSFIGLGVSAIHMIPFAEFILNSARFVPEQGFVSGTSILSLDAFYEHPLAAKDSIFLIGGYHFLGSLGIPLAFFAVMGFFSGRKTHMHAYEKIMSVFSLCMGFGFVLPYIIAYIPGLNYVRELYLYSPFIALFAGLLAAEGQNSLLEGIKRADSQSLSAQFNNKPWHISLLTIVILGNVIPSRISAPVAIIIICLLLIGVVLLFLFRQKRRSQKDKRDSIILIICLATLICGCDYYLTYSRSNQSIYSMENAQSAVETVIDSLQPLADASDGLPQSDGELPPYRVMSWSDEFVYDPSSMQYLGYREAFGHNNPAPAKAAAMHSMDTVKRVIMQNIRFLYINPNDMTTRDYYESLGYQWVANVDGLQSFLNPEQKGAAAVLRTNAIGEAWMVFDTLEYDDSLSDADQVARISATSFDPTVTAMIGSTDYQNSQFASPAGYNYSVEVKSFQAQRIVFEVDTEAEGVLVTSQYSYPGWNVYLDGQKIKAIEVNSAFIGLQMPMGQHTVEFRYEPMSFYAGAIITVFTLVASGIFLFLMLKGKKKEGAG